MPSAMPPDIEPTVLINELDYYELHESRLPCSAIIAGKYTIAFATKVENGPESQLYYIGDMHLRKEEQNYPRQTTIAGQLQLPDNLGLVAMRFSYDIDDILHPIEGTSQPDEMPPIIEGFFTNQLSLPSSITQINDLFFSGND